MKRLFISAVEPSGDRLGAKLVKALCSRGAVDFVGVAGPEMREAGVEAIADMENITAMGVIEVFSRLAPILNAKKTSMQTLEQGVDGAVFIDAPDFHLPLAKKAKQMGIISIGYVSPQIWAWRPSRSCSIAESFDQLLCLFSFEPPLYSTLDARWVGHPVVDRTVQRDQVDVNLFGLTPGSRQHEIDRMLPPFIEAAQYIRAQKPSSQFRIISPVSDLDIPNWIHRGDTIDDLMSARGVLTKSGTVTLELAVRGIPQVVAHRVHPITHWLGRRLVQGIRHIAMPNILSDSAVVPEFIQRFSPQELGDSVLNLPEHQSIDLSALGQPGAIDRAADTVWGTLEAA